MPKPWEKYQTTTTGKPWEKYSQTNDDKSWLETEIPLVGGKVGENLVRPLLQGAGAIGGGMAGAPLGPVGAVAGGGLGYAGAEEVYKMLGGRPSGTLGEELVKAGENVATGAAMEAGGQALPVVLSETSKIPGIAKSAVQKVLSKPRVVGSQVKEAGDILNVLKSEKEAFKPTMQTELENLKYIEEGLEPLTPAQMQTRAGGEPAPAQYTETLLKARDKGLYDQQSKQLQKYRDILEQYQNRGSATPEIAGQKVKEGLKAGKKATGEVIGEFKQAGKGVELGLKEYSLPIDEIDKFTLGSDYNKLLGIEDMYRQAKTVEQLDALSSNVGSQISEAARSGNNNYARKLKDMKTFLEDKVAQSIEGAGISKPKEAYEAYTAVNKLYNETLRGTTETGASKNVIKKITASGENIKQFKDTAKKLNTPELITTVKENWLSELFGEATEKNLGKWITKWTKYKKEGIAQNLLNKEDIKKIDLLANYYKKYTSTTTGAVNPSRTGVIGFIERVASQPVKSIVNYVLGDELKYARALKQYKAISKSTPGITKKGQKSVLPYMMGRDKE